ncbi:MAG: adenine nucleotide alpha hydrolase, partial [Candidatus Fermentibacterota bacterium]
MTGRVPEELRGALSEPDGLAVAVSGGLDSEVLLRAAAEVRGRDGVLALTADSPLLADHYRRVIRSLVGGL